MRPKQFLKELENDYNKAKGVDKVVALAKYSGAMMMYDLTRSKAREWHDAHRDEIREYNTKYVRERRKRLKEQGK